MRDLSLHILDIAKNSVQADAKNIEIYLVEREGWRTLTIRDDGFGMSQELLKTVTDPFTTTRTTRVAGLGLPLLKMAAERADGFFTIHSSQGAEHGTMVCAVFRYDHIDCVPVGDLPETIATLLQGSPDIDFKFEYINESGHVKLSTKEMRNVLREIPLDTPEVLRWVSELLTRTLTD